LNLEIKTVKGKGSNGQVDKKDEDTKPRSLAIIIHDG